MKAVCAFAVLTFVMMACNRDPDARMQRQIVGTWVATCQFTIGPALTNTITIAPDGSYECRIVSGSGRHYYAQGVFKVQQGLLVDTQTNNSTTNAPLPLTSRARIIRIDEREMQLRQQRIDGWTYPTNEPIYRKLPR